MSSAGVWHRGVCTERSKASTQHAWKRASPSDDNRQAGCSSAGLVFGGGRKGTSRASEVGGHSGSGGGRGEGDAFFCSFFFLFFSARAHEAEVARKVSAQHLQENNARRERGIAEVRKGLFHFDIIKLL